MQTNRPKCHDKKEKKFVNRKSETEYAIPSMLTFVSSI